MSNIGQINGLRRVSEYQKNRQEVQQYERCHKSPSATFRNHLLEIENCFKNVDCKYLEKGKQQKYRFLRGYINIILFDLARPDDQIDDAVSFARIGISMLEHLLLVDYDGKANETESKGSVMLLRNTLYNLGNIYLKLNDSNRASAYYERAVKYNHIPSMYNLAAISRHLLKDENEAEYYYIKAANTDFDDLGSAHHLCL